MQAIGPIGAGEHDGKQKPFNESPRAGDLGAVRIKTTDALHKIKTFTRNEMVELKPSKLRARDYTHWVILEANEYITYVEIRAGAWVDGLRIHTNLRSTRWFGGFGGQLQALRPHGGKINGFFGSRGDNCVGKLGVYCSGITERTAPTQAITFGLPATVFTMTSAGEGEADEPYSHFDTEGTQLGAIVVRCSDYIESIRVVTSNEHTRSTLDSHSPIYAEDDHVFALRHDEYLTKVSVRYGDWVDAVRFHTNVRSSEWFGGKGGNDTEEFECAPGFRICGFYGRTGDSVVDKLGVHICENAPIIKKIGPVGKGEDDGEQDPFCTEPTEQDLGAVLVKPDDEFLAEIHSYTREDFAGLSQSQLDDEKEQGNDWFVLEPNEYITAVKVRGMSWVDGLRFYTNQRKSPWYGGDGGKKHRLEAKSGHKIFGFFGTLGDTYVGELGVLTCPIDHP